jgi:hypothetical protein
MIVEAGRTQHGTCGNLLSANDLQVVDDHEISLSDLLDCSMHNQPTLTTQCAMAQPTSFDTCHSLPAEPCMLTVVT